MTPRIKNLVVHSICFMVFFVPMVAFAANTTKYVPLVGLPGLGNVNNLTTEDYINALYTLSISAAVFLVVIRIIFAGVQYMLSEIVTNKEQAKKDIGNALFGLLIIIGAVTLLNEINPNLTNFSILSNANSVNVNIQKDKKEAGCPANTRLVRTSGSSYECRTLSNVDRETTALAEAEAEARENGDLNGTVVRRVNLDGVSEADREEWAENCEVDSNGNETGNTVVENGGVARGVLEYLCVSS